MNKKFIDNLSEKLEDVKDAGLYKSERVITSQQSGKISVFPGDNVLNFCVNNYLGLADNEEHKKHKTHLLRQLVFQRNSLHTFFPLFV